MRRRRAKDSASIEAGPVATTALRPAGSGASSSRVPAGIIVLCLAMTALLVVPALLAPDVSGIATPVALPQPPPVGSCVLVDTAGAGGATDSTTGPLTVVPCTAPHDGEVSMSWPSFVQPRAKGSGRPQDRGFGQQVYSGTSGVNFTYFQCDGWNSAYLGDPPETSGPWEPSTPVTGGSLVYDTPDQHYDRLHWSACLVRPALTVDPYVGSVKDAVNRPTAARPSVYMPCLTQGTFGSSEFVYAACTLPHRVEVIGLDRDPGQVLPADQAQAGCTALVGMLAGTSDPTFGGRVSIQVGAASLRTMTAEQVADSGTIDSQDCMVQLVGDGALVGSLVGLDGAALPAAP